MKRYAKQIILIMACLIFVACFFYFPVFIEFLLILNLIVLFGLGISRLVLAGHQKTESSPPQQPFLTHKVSVHVPISQEPPEVVCNTIRSIINQTYRNLEVIVLCNFSPDEDLWKPVKEFCDYVDGRVKFRRVKSVKGHKAGALALCHKFTDPEAKYIFTVDGDYMLHHHAISYAVTRMEGTEIDMLQFPRAYLNGDSSTEGLLTDYGHYFNCYSAGANKFKACLPIGTLSFIKKAVLDDLGGWTDRSIAEEAELGIALLEKGYKPFFCNEEIGMGLMPNTNGKFNAQRSRWIFGNFQNLWNLLRSKSILPKAKWASAVQLTAWLNMLALPYLSIFFATVMILFTGRVFDDLLAIAIISMLAHAVFQYFIFGISTRFRFVGHNLGFLIHINSGILGAFSWCTYFFNKEKPFEMSNGFQRLLNDKFCGIFFSLLLMCCALLIGQDYSYKLGVVLGIYALLSFVGKLLLIAEFINSDVIIHKTIYDSTIRENIQKTT